jgi:hypothetical protein
MVLAADVDEVRVLGERRGERLPVHGLPRRLEAADDGLELAAVGRRQFVGQR